MEDGRETVNMIFRTPQARFLPITYTIDHLDIIL